MFHRGTIIGRKPSLLCLPSQFIHYQDIPQEDDLGPTVTATMDSLSVLKVTVDSVLYLNLHHAVQISVFHHAMVLKLKYIQIDCK